MDAVLGPYKVAIDFYILCRLSIMNLACILCGNLRDCLNYSVLPSVHIQNFLREYCKKTAFAYEWVYSRLMCHSDCSICYPCRNWISSRRSVHRNGKKHLVMLPLDSIIFYCIDPSNAIDMRLIRRVFRVLNDGSVYVVRLPSPVSVIMGWCRGDPNKIVHCWWRYNGFPEVLHNRFIAKKIRQCENRF